MSIKSLKKYFQNDAAGLLLHNERGVAPVLVVVAAVGLLSFLVISNSFSFRDQIFGKLFPKQFSKAAGATLSIVPAQLSSSSVAPNDTFNVDVSLDTGGESVTASNIVVKFDPQFLQLNTITQGTFLKGLFPTQPNPFIDNTGGAGVISLNVGITCTNPIDQSTCGPNPSAIGLGNLATLSFKAKKDTVAGTPTQITFDQTNTIVAAIGSSTSIASVFNNSSITINSQAPVNKTANFSLSPASTSKAAGIDIPVRVMVQTDTDAASYFYSKLSFDNTKLQVTSIDFDSANSFITQWEDHSFDNATGKISLTGGVPNPGLQTTGTAQSMATIHFQGLTPGLSSVVFDATSSIHKNSPLGEDILNTATKSDITISGAASPTPSPSPSPTPSPIPSPTPTPTPVPSPTPGVTPSPTPTPTPSPTPSPSPIVTVCTITDLAWNLIGGNNTLLEGTPVTFTAKSAGPCQNKQVVFNVYEDSGALPLRSVIKDPKIGTFGANGQASSQWLAQYMDDVVFGGNNEFIIKAKIVGETTEFTSTGSKITVTKLAANQFRKGDVNKDNVLNKDDKGSFFYWWNRPNYPFEADVYEDSATSVNAFDWSFLIFIFQTECEIDPLKCF